MSQLSFRRTLATALTAVLLCAMPLAAKGREDLDRPGAPGPPPATGVVDFAQEVRPIFAASCYSCHGPEKQKSGYRLDVRSIALKGGDLGPAIVPGKSADSPLIHYVAGLDEDMLMPAKGERLTAGQVGILRAWIDQGAAWPDDAATVKVKDKADHWAFTPATRPAVPEVRDAAWVRNPVDGFVLARLEKERLTPSPEADRRTLIRRVSFDLTGLPPAPERVEQFVSDADPEAYEKLVDELLASPRYGERWARHWLDVVHYGESHGYDKDKPRTNAWPYRDYVIRALNDDKPYPRFVQEQIAGDVLFPETSDGVIATGFIAAGPWDFVGHTELREGTLDKQITRSNDRDDMVMTAMSTFQSLTVHCARCHEHKFDPITQEDYYRLQAVFAGVERGERPAKGEPSGKVFAAVPLPKPRSIHLLNRGDVKQPREVVAAGTLAVFAGKDATFGLPSADDEGARRAALAKWLTEEGNLLTRRSIVNRVWHYHFGRGIAETPNDFGHMGAPPTHPELLDWLAFWFLDEGESLKNLHRLIVTSSTYRQSSTQRNEQAEKADADNRLLWRVNRQRLDAESLRDAILAAGGKLDLTMGGPSVQRFAFKDDHSPVYDYAKFDVDAPGSFRRSVYRFIVRSVPEPMMDTLDCPDPSVLAAKRNTTITALQALTMLNNPFVVRQAEHLAGRVAKEAPEPPARVRRLYELTLGRPPTEEEARLLADHAARHGLANACRVLLNSNEFMFVD